MGYPSASWSRFFAAEDPFVRRIGKRRTLRLGRIALYREYAVAYKKGGIDREREIDPVRLQKV